jgi:hypothetical protein
MGGMNELIATFGNRLAANDIARRKAADESAVSSANVGNINADAALRGQQTEAARLANIQSRLDLQDQQIVSDSFRESGGDPSALIQAVIKKGASPKAVFGLQQGLIARQQAAAAASLEQNKLVNEQHDRLGGLLETVQAAAPEDRQAVASQVIDTAVKEGLAKPGEYDPAKMADDKWLTAHINATRMLGGIAAAKAKEQDIQVKAAQAVKDTADAAKAKSDQALTDLKFNLMKGVGADSINKTADSLADPKQFPDANNAMKTQGRLAMETGDINKVSETISGIYKEMVVPQLASTVSGKVREQAALLPGEVQKAAAVANATIGAHVAEQVQAEVAKSRMAVGTGQIVDPRQRAEVDRILDTADKEAQKSIGDAMRLKQDVQMSQGGNRVTPNLETIQTLRSIVNRVNANELKQVGASGNAIDWLKSKGGSWVSGQPIPDNIQKDFASIADADVKLAQATHATVYGTVAQKYGLSGLQPPDIAGIYQKVSGSAPSSTSRPPLSSFQKK